MDLGEAVMLAVGLGFRKACSADTLVRLVRHALAEAATRASWTEHPVLATIAEKDRPVLRAAAAELGLDLIVLPKSALQGTEDRITVVSDTAQACLGIPSVAEAAALAAAGSGSRLLVTRIAVSDATCAVAVAATASA